MVVRISRDFAGVRVLTEQWPVIVIDFPQTRVPDAAINDSLSYLEDLFTESRDNKERTYTITDMTQMYEFPTSSQRKYTTDWTTRTLPLQKVASVGGAMVIRGTMLRAFISAVHWVAPPGMPTIIVTTREEAFEEAVKAFDAAGAPLGAEVREALVKR